jgi:large subunit ribosomal protein L19e
MLNAGESKVRFKLGSMKKIEEAITREDVRALIKDGAIYAIAPRGVSRARGRGKAAKLRKGRRGGMGSRKGTPSARLGSKKAWMAKVRAQRRFLSSLVGNEKLAPESARKIYLMVKGNAFKSVKIMETYLKDNKLLS